MKKKIMALALNIAWQIIAAMVLKKFTARFPVKLI